MLITRAFPSRQAGTLQKTDHCDHMVKEMFEKQDVHSHSVCVHVDANEEMIMNDTLHQSYYLIQESGSLLIFEPAQLETVSLYSAH